MLAVPTIYYNPDCDIVYLSLEYCNIINDFTLRDDAAWAMDLESIALDIRDIELVDWDLAETTEESSSGDDDPNENHESTQNHDLDQPLNANGNSDAGGIEILDNNDDSGESNSSENSNDSLLDAENPPDIEYLPNNEWRSFVRHLLYYGSIRKLSIVVSTPAMDSQYNSQPEPVVSREEFEMAQIEAAVGEVRASFKRHAESTLR